MTNRDRTPCGLDISQSSGTWPEYLTIRELWDEALDRVIQPEATFLDKQQRSAGSNQFCIGVNAENVVNAQWSLIFLIGPTGTVHVHEIPPHQHRAADTRKDVGVYIPLHCGMHGCEIVVTRDNLHLSHCNPPLLLNPSRARYIQ